MKKFLKTRLMYVIGWIVGYIPLSFMVSVHGRKNISHCGEKYIITANHESYIDPYIITALFPLCFHLRWIAKRSLRNTKMMMKDAEREVKLLKKRHNGVVKFLRVAWYKFSVFFARATGTIIIKEGVSTVKRCVDILEKNEGIVGIFPTGVRRYIDQDMHVHKSFIIMARMTNVPIIPVCLNRIGLMRWHMVIHKPIHPSRLSDKTFGSTDYERAKNIMRLIDDRF